MRRRSCAATNANSATKSRSADRVDRVVARPRRSRARAATASGSSGSDEPGERAGAERRDAPRGRPSRRSRSTSRSSGMHVREQVVREADRLGVLQVGAARACGASGARSACSSSASTSVERPAGDATCACVAQVQPQSRWRSGRCGDARRAACRRGRRRAARCSPRSSAVCTSSSATVGRNAPDATSASSASSAASIRVELVVVEQARPGAARGRAPASPRCRSGASRQSKWTLDATAPAAPRRARRRTGRPRAGRRRSSPCSLTAACGRGAPSRRRPRRPVRRESRRCRTARRAPRRAGRQAADLDEALGLGLVEGVARRRRWRG